MRRRCGYCGHSLRRRYAHAARKASPKVKAAPKAKAPRAPRVPREAKAACATAAELSATKKELDENLFRAREAIAEVNNHVQDHREYAEGILYRLAGGKDEGATDVMTGPRTMRSRVT